MGTWVERSTGLLPAINNWWEISTVDPSDIVAVYQPIGADSLAKSYTNLVNPGTNDASPIVAPTWSDTVGWTFSGTEHLTTGIVGNGNQTYIVRINNAEQSITQRTIMGYSSGRSQFLGILFLVSFELPSRYNTGNFGTTGSGYVGDMIVCMARRSTYVNGAFVEAGGIALETWSEGEISIANDLGINKYIGDISALAIYNRELTQPEIAEIGGNMSALTSADDPDPVLPSVNYIVQNPATKRLNSLSHELWAAASSGIFRTFNGGREWAKITLPDPSNAEFSDSPAATVNELTFHWIGYDPTDNTILYAMAAKAASSRVWIYKATNSGVNVSDWTSRGVTT
jgi:hypothetical protein